MAKLQIVYDKPKKKESKSYPTKPWYDLDVARPKRTTTKKKRDSLYTEIFHNLPLWLTDVIVWETKKSNKDKLVEYSKARKSRLKK